MPRAPSGGANLVSGTRRHKALAGVLLIGLVVASAVAGYLHLARADKTAIDSVAVLPFANVGGDPNTEYLSDGIPEALINSLTELQQLKVMARGTAFRYKGKEVDPRAVGRELNVRAVLTGRVRKTGDRLSVQVDLVDTATGAQLWGQEYERGVSDVLSVKQTIAREVTEKLRLRLSGEQRQQLARRDTANSEAYQYYLRGRYYWNKRTAEGIRKAIEEFQQAVDRDPGYALGYAGLADCYLFPRANADAPDGEAYAKAKAYAERALQVDASLAEAHATLGRLNDISWKWDEAGKEYRRAIELNPNYPTAHQWYGIHLRFVGRFDESLSEAKRAQELDPLSLVISSNVATAYLIKGDVNSAAEQGKRILELDPNFHPGYDVLGGAYLKQGRYAEAVAVLEKGLPSDEGGHRGHQGILGYAYALAGRRAEALALLKRLEGEYARQKVGEMPLALVYEGLGERDQAFAWLEKALQARRPNLPSIRWDPEWDSIRGDPRYADLVRRMGLQP